MVLARNDVIIRKIGAFLETEVATMATMEKESPIQEGKPLTRER